jgi:hypothetical protein
MVKIGSIAGVAVVLWHLLFYFLDKKLYFHPGVQWGVLPIYLAAMYLACRTEARQSTGLYAWQPALRTAFGTFVFTHLIAHVFYFVFLKYIDPGMLTLQAELFAEGLERNKNWLGEENAWKIKDQYQAENFQPTFQKSAFSFAFGLIGGFILALLIAWLTYGKAGFSSNQHPSNTQTPLP